MRIRNGLSSAFLLPMVLLSESMAYTVEKQISTTPVITICGEDKVEALTYTVHENQEDSQKTAKKYFFLNGEKTPFMTYDVISREIVHDLDRNGLADRKQRADAAVSSAYICDVVKQLKRR